MVQTIQMMLCLQELAAGSFATKEMLGGIVSNCGEETPADETLCFGVLIDKENPIDRA